MTGDVSTEAPAYAAALEQYTDPARSYFATRSLPRLMLGPRDRDERLSGIRLPVSEADERAIVARWRDREEPPRGTWAWLPWALARRMTDRLEALDAERAWENEGGR